MEARVSGQQALYLYGILAHPAHLPSHCDAVEEGTSLDVIAASGIACVVSAVSARDYESPATGRNAAEQVEWVTPRALRHHHVVRRLHATSTVIPLKFGTLCNSVDDVRDMLTQYAEPLGALLARFDGKDEWTLTIHVDAERVTAALEQNDAALIASRIDEELLPDGRAYFERKKRQQRIAHLLALHVAATTEIVYERIAPAIDAHTGENRPASARALLVDRARFDDLAARLAELEAEQRASGLSLELSGPWAPYSFVNGRVDCREPTPASGIGSRTLVH